MRKKIPVDLETGGLLPNNQFAIIGDGPIRLLPIVNRGPYLYFTQTDENKDFTERGKCILRDILEVAKAHGLDVSPFEPKNAREVW